MFGRRSDLPLDSDPLSRFLPWLIAFMVYLAVLALAGALVLNAVIVRWDRGVTGTLTVQIAPLERPPSVAAADARADEERRQKAVLELLSSVPEVARAEALDDLRLMALLEPWLGTTEVIDDLPLPRLIDVELKPGTNLDVAALAARLAKAVPGTAIDDHKIWLERLVRLIRTVEVVASVVLVFIGLATVGTVVFATRTGLAIHQEAIEVLHLIGAQDSYVAQQFASRALVLGLRGGIIGLVLAVPTLFAISYLAAHLEAGLLPDIDMGMAHWSALAGMPVAAALIAMVTARMTVLRTLARML
jgi:cell division transport system permease protein